VSRVGRLETGTSHYSALIRPPQLHPRVVVP
jgi:hypothetical protein